MIAPPSRPPPKLSEVTPPKGIDDAPMLSDVTPPKSIAPVRYSPKSIALVHVCYPLMQCASAMPSSEV
jgi:hypothetical protein